MTGDGFGRRASFALVLALHLAVSGCGDATGILVEVGSEDLSVGADVDALVFDARASSGRTVTRRFSIHADWPHSLTILPSADTDGEVVISVTALRADRFVTHRVVRTSFSRGTTRRVDVALTAACVGVRCAEEVDCVRGRCEDRAASDAGSDAAAQVDAGADPPADGGPGLDGAR